ncbi:cytochrome b5 [Nematocida major]|uniref:cytochrome b5 n=1 Tax=Nematocida major TaxID=1912982 RepID=UPI002008902D|nr:cytochrome b5 [Nematocida major]KAH9386925.1 cytochrome b5 [Nematocida major]
MIQIKPRPYTLEEVSAHKCKKSCWIVLSGIVYDVTDYLKDHPGGSNIILENAGKDCTEIFNTIHPWINYKKLLKKYLIGYVQKTEQREEAQEIPQESPCPGKDGCCSL